MFFEFHKYILCSMNNGVWVWEGRETEIFVQDFLKGGSRSFCGDKNTHARGGKMQAGCTVLMHFKSRLDQQFLLWAHTSLGLQTHLLKVRGTELRRWQRDASAKMPYFVDVRHYRGIFINLLPPCGWFWVTGKTETFSKQHKHKQQTSSSQKYDSAHHQLHPAVFWKTKWWSYSAFIVNYQHPPLWFSQYSNWSITNKWLMIPAFSGKTPWLG